MNVFGVLMTVFAIVFYKKISRVVLDFILTKCFKFIGWNIILELLFNDYVVEKFGDFVLDEISYHCMLLFEVSIWIRCINVMFIIAIKRLIEIRLMRFLIRSLSRGEVEISI